MKNESAQPQLPPLDDEYESAIAPYPKAPPVCVLKEACNCRERQLLSALAENKSLQAKHKYFVELHEAEMRKLLAINDSLKAENESLKAAKPLRMFVWDGRGKYKVCACTTNIAEARTLALEEMSLRGDLLGMREYVKQEQPHIYLRPNAEVVLSENGETEELNICLESESARRQSAEYQLAAMKTERDAVIAELKLYKPSSPMEIGGTR